MAITIPESILNQMKLAYGLKLNVPWEDNYKNIASQLQSIQSQVDIYKGGSPLQASQHINNIATSLARDYGISSLGDIGVRQVSNVEMVPIMGGIGESEHIAGYERVERTIPEYFNKNDPTKIIPENKFASEGAGKGYSNYNLQAVSDGKGGTIVLPVQQYSLSGFSEFAADAGPLLAVAAIAIQFVPGIGQAVGYAVLGAGDVIAGAALAGNIAAATGISTITAASVVAATGAATIAAGITAAQGGDGADIIRAAATAGSASITNVAAGGGILGASAGSAVGTAIAGGNLENVATNVVAAATGAAASGAFGAGSVSWGLVSS
jgi:hypothetical protein